MLSSLRAVSTGEGKLRKIKESVHVENANRRPNACSGRVDSPQKAGKDSDWPFGNYAYITHNYTSMASIDVAILEGQEFKSATDIICQFFQVKTLHNERLQCIKAFFRGKDVYFSAGTGYGKSLVYQPMPLFHDLLIDQAIGTSIGIIICPLTSLMLDQVAHLHSLGINAVAVHADQDPKVLVVVEEGIYSHVYISPESMLSHQRWRKMLQSPNFQEHCVVVAVDEAHSISQW